MYEPLDVLGEPLSLEDDAYACQHRCANTDGCAHFTFWMLGKHCHLEGALAMKFEGRVGFIAGPSSCHSATCLEVGVKYFDAGTNGRTWSCDTCASLEEVIDSCRDVCVADEHCTHFTVNHHLNICTIASSRALRLQHVPGFISGSPECDSEASTLVMKAISLKRPQMGQSDAFLTGTNVRTWLTTWSLSAVPLLCCVLVIAALRVYKCRHCPVQEDSVLLCHPLSLDQLRRSGWAPLPSAA